MSKIMKYGIVCLLLLSVGAILYMSGYYGSNSYAKKDVNVDEIRWEKDYDSQSNHPYGSYFLHELIDRGFEGYKLRNLNHSVADYFQHDSLKVNAEVVNYFSLEKPSNFTMMKLIVYLPLLNVEIIYSLLQNFSQKAYLNL